MSGVGQLRVDTGSSDRVPHPPPRWVENGPAGSGRIICASVIKPATLRLINGNTVVACCAADARTAIAHEPMAVERLALVGHFPRSGIVPLVSPAMAHEDAREPIGGTVFEGFGAMFFRRSVTTFIWIFGLLGRQAIASNLSLSASDRVVVDADLRRATGPRRGMILLGGEPTLPKDPRKRRQPSSQTGVPTTASEHGPGQAPPGSGGSRVNGRYRRTRSLTSLLPRRRQPRVEICLEQRRGLDARSDTDTRAEFFDIPRLFVIGRPFWQVWAIRVSGCRETHPI